MIFLTFLALFNGVCITLSRVWNGQLADRQGSFRASFVNHLVGFLFLSLIMLMVMEMPQLSGEGNLWVYLGGFIGAFYVAINSFLISRFGSTNSMLFVISGQMLFGLLLDASFETSQELLFNVSGVVLIIAGIYLKNSRWLKPKES